MSVTAKESKKTTTKRKNEPKVINILELVNPAHYDLWLTDRPYVIAKGGRSSFKSSTIALRLVYDFLGDSQGNVIVLRKVAKYLRTSVYEQIVWAIMKMGAEQEFTFLSSPMKIIHNKTGTAFYFFGVDDPKKLKSAKIAKGYVFKLFFEEAAEFHGVPDLDIVSDSFIREDLGVGKSVQIFYAYNPPRNPFDWINEWVNDKLGDDDYLVHHSTYLDDELGFLSEQMRKKIDRYKQTDYDYYRWMYMGEVIGLGDTIYNTGMMKPLDALPKNDDIIYIDTTSDTGHQISATTHLALGYTKRKNVILLDTWYYSPENKVDKKAPSELSKEYKEWIEKLRDTYHRPIRDFFIDSAEGALRNQVYKDHHIRMKPVGKLKKDRMIEYVHDLFAQGRFYYLNTSNNAIFLTEHQKYQWDPKTTRSDTPKPVKIDDHTCDAFQYYVVMSRRQLGLAV